MEALEHKKYRREHICLRYTIHRNCTISHPSFLPVNLHRDITKQKPALPYKHHIDNRDLP